MKRPKTIAGKKVRTGDLKVAAMIAVFAIVPAWDILICYGSEWYVGITIFALARAFLWTLMSFGIVVQSFSPGSPSSWMVVMSAGAAFLLFIPVELIYCMSADFYMGICAAVLLRIIVSFAIIIAVAGAKAIL